MSSQESSARMYLTPSMLLISATYAAWRGFLSETLSIFAWAAAAFATLYFGPWLIPLMRGVIEVSSLAVSVLG